MKILKGDLTETRYEFPREEDEDTPMEVISERVHKENAVAYMSDELGVHSMSNAGSDFAVSLHRRFSQPRPGRPELTRRSIHPAECRSGRMPRLQS